MPKKHKLTGDFTPEYLVIGLSSQARGYKLAMLVNEKLELHLKRMQDFPGPRQDLNYALYQHEDKDLRRTYYLLNNRHTEGLLVTSLKGIDAFLIVYESFSSKEIKALLAVLRKGTGIQAAYEIKVPAVKDFDALMEDLEVHLLNIKKPAED